jgi:hypothetical protein
MDARSGANKKVGLIVMPSASLTGGRRGVGKAASVKCG